MGHTSPSSNSSSRTQKVARIVRQTVAAQLAQLPGAAYLTVTAVDVAPNLRSCTVWIGVTTTGAHNPAEQFDQVLGDSAGDRRRTLQRAVAAQLTTKFVPRLSFRHDTGGAYADHINRLLGSM